MLDEIPALLTTHQLHLEGVILLLWVLWNILGFMVYAVDKRRAIHNRWRVSERTLLFYLICGAGIGCWLAMTTLRHKTKKRRFKLGALVGVTVNVIFLAYVWQLWVLA